MPNEHLFESEPRPLLYDLDLCPHCRLPFEACSLGAATARMAVDQAVWSPPGLQLCGEVYARCFNSGGRVLSEIVGTANTLIEARKKLNSKSPPYTWGGWLNPSTGRWVPIFLRDVQDHPDVTIRGETVSSQVVAQAPVETSQPSPPIPILLWCPSCGSRHLDEGEFATKPHHTHSCQSCGMVWRPALVPTVGVQFLPGFKNP